MIRHAWNTLRLAFRHWSTTALMGLQGFFIFLLAPVSLESTGQAMAWYAVITSVIAVMNGLGIQHEESVRALPSLPLGLRKRAVAEAAGGLALPVVIALAAVVWVAPELLLGLLALLPMVFAVTVLRHFLSDAQRLAVVLVPAAALVLGAAPMAAVLAIPAFVAIGPVAARKSRHWRLPVRRGRSVRELAGPLDDVVRGWMVGSAIALFALAPVWVVTMFIEPGLSLPFLGALAVFAFVAGPHVRPAGLFPTAVGTYAGAFEVLPIPRRVLARRVWLTGMIAASVPVLLIGLRPDVGGFVLQFAAAAGFFGSALSVSRVLGNGRLAAVTLVALVLYVFAAVGIPVVAVIEAWTESNHQLLLALSVWIPLSVPLLAALIPVPKLLAPPASMRRLSSRP